MVDMTGPDLVTVYWRPGCPYCAGLRRGLRRAGLQVTEVNIWKNPEAAAVRALAGGNETVPTVVVAGAGMVNPRLSAVLDAVRDAAPELLAGPLRSRAAPRRGIHPAPVDAGGRPPGS